jgi:hypothetical protein
MKMGKRAVILCLCVAALGCAGGESGEGKAPPRLFRIVQHGKSGFIDNTGKVVIRPEYDCVSSFSGGLAAVNLGGRMGRHGFEGGKWGYIDTEGKLAIKPQFDWSGDFSEGLAGVRLGDKWGYIDEHGKVAIAPQFCEVSPFTNSMAFAFTSKTESGDATYVYIDTRGNPVSPPQKRVSTQTGEWPIWIADGLVPVCREENGRQMWGLMDASGKLVVPHQFSWICRFREGLAKVMLDEGKMAYIDKTGKVVIPVAPYLDSPSFSDGFADGLASVAVPRSPQDPPPPFKTKGPPLKYGFIDKTGKAVIPPRFDWVEDFKDGLAAVRIGDRSGYIDKMGTMVITLPPGNDWPVHFSEGLAPFKEDSRWGYIDKTGKIAIKPQFDVARDFCDGLAWVEIDGKSGYIDKAGKYVWVPTK